MNLTPIAHLESKYIRKMKRLNREAFPKKERINFNELLDLSNSDHFDFLAIKEGETFVGFFLIAKNKHNIYLFFFAVTKKQRSEENGSRMLELLREYYPYQQIVLDLEEVDENGPNAKNCALKKEFYSQNGFYETGYELQHANMTFELLCNKKLFDEESFRNFLGEIEPDISRLKKEPFEPTLIEKSEH